MKGKDIKGVSNNIIKYPSLSLVLYNKRERMLLHYVEEPGLNGNE